MLNFFALWNFQTFAQQNSFSFAKINVHFDFWSSARVELEPGRKFQTRPAEPKNDFYKKEEMKKITSFQ